MAIFKLSTEKAAQRDIDAARTTHNKLVTRLADAVAVVTDRTRAAQALAIEGADDNMLDNAEASLRAAIDRVETLRNALAQSEARLNDAEKAQADFLDSKQRRETNAQILELVEDLGQVGRECQAVLGRMTDVTGRCAAVEHWSAIGLHSFASTSQPQVAEAGRLIEVALRAHAAAVLSGTARAAMPRPDVPAAAKEVAPMPRVKRVFSVKAIRWTDHEGKLKTATKYCDVDLPVATAARALASGVCRPIGSDVWREQGGHWPCSHPDAAECIDLDAPGDAMAAPMNADPAQIEHPADQRLRIVDRGPPRIVPVPREA